MRFFFKFLNIIALAVLLLSCMAAYIEPQVFWQLSFIGFAFPIVLIINFLFLVIWIIKRDTYGLLPLIAIVLTWKFIETSFALNFKEENKESGIKLMTWNAKNFDLYNWSHNKNTRKEMMKLIKDENPDIICFQEFYSEETQSFNNVKYLSDTLKYPYHYFQPTTTLQLKRRKKPGESNRQAAVIPREWGVAIFSKYKIDNTGRIDFANSRNNDCIFADVEIAGKPCRIYSAHFESIHLVGEDYAALDSLQEKRSANWNVLKTLVKKMKHAYTKRAVQANAVAEHMSRFEGAKILCGDFNDVPVSYTYQTVRGEMIDAFVEKGRGFGATFAHKFSVFRIDYSLFDKRIKINSYKTIRRELSDHYPVVTTFTL